MQPQFSQQNAFPVIERQTYEAMNRGDMFVPAGSVHSPIGLAQAATPFMGRLMNVHAVPFTYTRPNAKVRTHGAIGMATPEGSVR